MTQEEYKGKKKIKKLNRHTHMTTVRLHFRHTSVVI